MSLLYVLGTARVSRRSHAFAWLATPASGDPRAASISACGTARDPESVGAIVRGPGAAADCVECRLCARILQGEKTRDEASVRLKGA